MVNASKKFVLCKGTSGMGNRILAACTALLYGEITQRDVIIDWRDQSYSDAGENAFSRFFDCPKAASLAQLPTTEAIFPEVWIGRLDQSLGEVRSHLKEQGQPHEMPHLSFDLAQADYPEDILVFCAYTHLINELRPLFQGEFAHLDNLDTAAILRSVLDAKLPLVPTIRQGIDEFKQQSFGATTIGVHVRYTDIKVPLEKLIAKVQQVARQHTDPVIFLATDSAAVIDQFQAQFPRLAMIDKWFPPEGQRLHQNWDNCPSRYDNGVEALTDLFLLAECDRLVFSSKSSFGYVASLLSRAGDHHIFDIELEGSWMRRVARKSQALLKTLSVKG